MYRICRLIATFLFIICRRIKYVGKEYIPQEGAVLIVTNHTSNVDPITVALATKRRMSFMAKKELFVNPLLGRFLRSLGGYPIDRAEMDRDALRHSIRLLQTGQVLAIFPEGTRGNGVDLLPFKNGAAYIASQAPCTVVPMGIRRGNSLFKYFRPPVEVNIGAGLTYRVKEGESKRDALERFLAEQEAAVRQLMTKNEK